MTTKDVYTLPINPARAAAQARQEAAQELNERQGVAAPQEQVPPKRMQPKVSIEYKAPHWYIVVKTPSGKWESLCDPTRRVTQQNAFGDTLQTAPAIKTFTTYQEAYAGLLQRMPYHRLVKRNPFFSSLGSLLNPFQ